VKARLTTGLALGILGLGAVLYCALAYHVWGDDLSLGGAVRWTVWALVAGEWVLLWIVRRRARGKRSRLMVVAMVCVFVAVLLDMRELFS